MTKRQWVFALLAGCAFASLTVTAGCGDDPIEQADDAGTGTWTEGGVQGAWSSGDCYVSYPDLVSGRAEADSVLLEAARIWKREARHSGPATYVFVLRTSLESWDNLEGSTSTDSNVYRIVVRDDVPVEVTAGEGADNEPGTTRVEGLFAQIAQSDCWHARGEFGGVSQLVFDEKLGYPSHVVLESSGDTSGAAWTYSIECLALDQMSVSTCPLPKR